MSRNGKREWSARLLAGKCRGAATPLSTSRTWGEKLGLCQTRPRSIRNFRFRDLPIADPRQDLAVTGKSQRHAYGRQRSAAHNADDDFDESTRIEQCVYLQTSARS